MIYLLLALATLTALTATPLATAALDTAKIDEITGLKGVLNEAERVFKVSQPRGDVKVSGRLADAAVHGPHVVGGIHRR